MSDTSLLGFIHGYSHGDKIKQYIRSQEFLQDNEEKGIKIFPLFVLGEDYNMGISYFYFPLIKNRANNSK